MILSEGTTRVANLNTGPGLGSLDQGRLSITWNYYYLNEIKNEVLFEICESFNFRKGNYFLIFKFFKSLDWFRSFKKLNANEIYELFLRLYDCAWTMTKTGSHWKSEEATSMDKQTAQGID